MSHQKQSTYDLIAALQEIQYKRRAILVLRFYGQYKLAEIAEMLDIPLGTVSSNLRRGIGEPTIASNIGGVGKTVPSRLLLVLMSTAATLLLVVASIALIARQSNDAETITSGTNEVVSSVEADRAHPFYLAA